MRDLHVVGGESTGLRLSVTVHLSAGCWKPTIRALDQILCFAGRQGTRRRIANVEHAVTRTTVYLSLNIPTLLGIERWRCHARWRGE